jgi:hypothetical protein
MECKHGQLARSCEICERDAEIARLTAELAVVTGLLDGTFGQCVYCGKRDIPISSTDHWLECPSNPGRARVAELEAERDRLLVECEAWREKRLWSETLVDFPGLKTVWWVKTDKYPILCCATLDGSVDALMAEREVEP